MGGGSSLAGEKVSKWIWWWELCGQEHHHILRVRVEKEGVGGVSEDGRGQKHLSRKGRESALREMIAINGLLEVYGFELKVRTFRKALGWPVKHQLLLRS